MILISFLTMKFAIISISYESSDSKLDVSRDGLNLYMLCMYQESFPQTLCKHCNEHDGGEILGIHVPTRGYSKKKVPTRGWEI
jgi:hypothetical protein